ncbi:O-succinylbenzoate synthase [Thermoflexales bacterium]|nr:O-succinylbenzoate synthase [Thermoflexales bacterium]
MSIDRITLYLVNLRLVAPFETSFGIEHDRQCVIVRVEADGLTGWGECPAERTFGYSYETTTTVWHALKDFLIPRSLGQPIDLAATCHLGERLRGHNMARHGLEAALWDIVAQQQALSLSKALGGTRDRVAVGVSIGIQASADALIAKIEDYLAQGYGRIKIKIKPGYDLEIVKRVRERFPQLLLQVDANSAYHLPDAPLFEAMDEYGLLLIEQPFGWDDIYEHSQLQPLLKTSVCLDESIHSLGHAALALELKACRVINIKPARVSGFTESRRIHDLCQVHDIPVWCGGMLETGIGRAGNVALASLPNFTLPGDISASKRYYTEDIAEPLFVLNPDSTLSVPTTPGLGVTVNEQALHRFTERKEIFGTRIERMNTDS